MHQLAEDYDNSIETGLYNRYFPAALRYLSSLTRDPMLAEDLAQEALLILLQKLHTTDLCDWDHLDAYVFRIARNLWIARLRRCDSQRLIFTDNLCDEAVEPAPDYLADEARYRTAWERALARQPVARDREILARHYIKEQSKSDICQALGLSPTHFDRVLSRARARLRSLAERWTHGQDLSPAQLVDHLCA